MNPSLEDWLKGKFYLTVTAHDRIYLEELEKLTHRTYPSEGDFVELSLKYAREYKTIRIKATNNGYVVYSARDQVNAIPVSEALVLFQERYRVEINEEDWTKVFKEEVC